MTVAASKPTPGLLQTYFDNAGESIIASNKVGTIQPDLTVGVDLSRASQLNSNSGIASQGVIPLGLGFRLSSNELIAYKLNKSKLPNVVRPYLNGRDLVGLREEKYVIDLTGYSESNARNEHPLLYQHLLVHVKPERDQNRRDVRRKNWWLFGENAPTFRAASKSLNRYIATCRTAKHRIFQMVSADNLPDTKVIAIAIQDAYFLSVLTSKLHSIWCHRLGGFLEDRPTYNHADCFNKFPFPAATPAQEARIRELGERLDAHRKARQAEHPSLTITGMYNVLGKLRKGEALTAKEKEIHEQGLVSVLKEIHDELDAAVFEAYGWPGDLSDEEILERLVALNAERAAEERQGKVRWLRPEYQCPGGAAVQLETDADESVEAAPAVPTAKVPWPKAMPDRARAVRAALAGRNAPATAEEVAMGFSNAKRASVLELLETLAALGQCRRVDSDRYAA